MLWARKPHGLILQSTTDITRDDVDINESIIIDSKIDANDPINNGIRTTLIYKTLSVAQLSIS